MAAEGWAIAQNATTARFFSLEGEKAQVLAALNTSVDAIVNTAGLEAKLRTLSKDTLESDFKRGSPLGNAAIAMLLCSGFVLSEDKQGLVYEPTATTQLVALQAAIDKAGGAPTGGRGGAVEGKASGAGAPGGPGGPAAGAGAGAGGAAPAAAGSDVLLALRVDFPAVVQVAQLDGSQSIGTFLVGASRLLGIERTSLARYTIRAARLGSDVIELSEAEIARTPLNELGITTGWSLLFAAPADLKPAPRRRRKEVVSDGKEEESSESKFAGLSPSNIFSKLRGAKGKTLAVIQEYIDKKWPEIATTARRDILALPATTLVEIFKRDSLNVKEIDLFNIALAWAREENKRKSVTSTPETLRTAIAPILIHIRLPVLTASDMAGAVAPSGVLLPEQLLALFSHVATAAARGGASSSSSSSAKKIPGAMGPKVAGFIASKRTGGGTSFKFDPSRKGTVLVLSNGDRTVTGGPSTVAGTVLATVGFTEGQHYWEMKIDKGRTGGHLFIGLCLESMDVNQYLSATGAQISFGWYHTAAYGVPGALAQSPTGTFTFAMGDNVGFLLDCDRHTLSMYVNKRYTGQVTLPAGNKYYPAFGCYGQEEQITLLEDVEMPPPR